jgi:hypothetical protein
MQKETQKWLGYAMGTEWRADGRQDQANRQQCRNQLAVRRLAAEAMEAAAPPLRGAGTCKTLRLSPRWEFTRLMQLKTIQIRNFKSIDDSGPIKADFRLVTPEHRFHCVGDS